MLALVLLVSRDSEVSERGVADRLLELQSDCERILRMLDLLAARDRAGNDRES